MKLNNNKILIKLYVPVIEQDYDVWIPLNKSIYNIINLLMKGIKEFSDELDNPTHMLNLYDKLTGEKYDINKMVKDTSIRNGSEIILI